MMAYKLRWSYCRAGSEGIRKIALPRLDEMVDILYLLVGEEKSVVNREQTSDNEFFRGQDAQAMRSRDGLHIVVTDINHHVRDFLQRELEKEGYSVVSAKTGSIAYERLCSSLPLDLIILDPEVFHCFDQPFIEAIVRRRPLLQIIIHTYIDSIANIQPSQSVHLVEKNGRSIDAIKALVRSSYELGNRPP